MDFLKILRSFEEFIVEATSWLVFLPLTMWRIVRHPLKTMEYSDREQSDSEEHRYDDAISPPLMLLATLVIANMIASALHVAPPHEGSDAVRLVTASQQNLILFRSLVFSLAPLVMALTLLRRQGKKLSRGSLRAPFYAQCYLAAPIAAVTSAGGVITQRPDMNNAVGVIIMLAGLAWFIGCEMAWFRAKLSLSWAQAGLLTAWAVLRIAVYVLALLVVLALL